MEQPVYHYEIEQGTDEWLKIRLGIVTASEVNNILTPTGKPCKNEKMRAYAAQKASERVFEFIDDHFESYDMMRGHFQEEIARGIYDENYSEVKECGFITRKLSGSTIGASPDGLVSDDGSIEIKSRLAKFQVKTIIMDEVPAEYMNQIQAVMLVSGRKWCDFIQYSNGMPLFVKRVNEDKEWQERIISAVNEFESVIVEMMENYKTKSSGLVQTERVEIDLGNGEIE